MKDKETEIQKVCGFYVNDWHFTTMILPYVRKEIEGNKKVITFFQDSMKAKVEEMLSKMNLNKTFEKKILEMNWNKAKKEEMELEKENTYIESVKEDKQTIDILVKGDNEFIDTINKKIETVVKELGRKTKITIINFYDLSKNREINPITKKHEYVINTAGTQRIEKETKTEKEA